MTHIAEQELVQAKGMHFYYESGIPYLPFGTTVYALLYQPKERIRETMETMKHSPFNKIRMCVFPKYLVYNQEEPERFPFERKGDRWDFHAPCEPFWQDLEDLIREFAAMGVQVDLILFHPYDRWGFSSLTYEECSAYLNYVVDRLSGHPNLWWSLANEFDNVKEFDIEWWPRFAQLIAEKDQKKHLLSNHNCLVYWDFHNPETTHCCIQDENVQLVPEYQKKYGKPVVFDECCYEGTVPYTWGNISGFELVHRFWTAVVYGGYCSHGETFWNQEEVLWWSKGGVLKGESPSRIGFLRGLAESFGAPLEYYEEPHLKKQLEQLEALKTKPDQVDAMEGFAKRLVMQPYERILSFINGTRRCIGHVGEEVFLLYLGKQCTVETVLYLPETGSYRIELIDIWEMTRTVVETEAAGETKISLPGKEGMAVLARRNSR